MIKMIPSGKRLHNCGKSPFFMGKSTISMAIFNSYVDITRGYPFPASAPLGHAPVKAAQLIPGVIQLAIRTLGNSRGFWRMSWPVYQTKKSYIDIHTGDDIYIYYIIQYEAKIIKKTSRIGWSHIV